MAILARAGVPGFVLWLVLQTTFGVTLFLKYIKDRRFNRVTLARTEAWILMYWMAFLINATFDVTIEGPQGGIWFWSVFGFGLALILDSGHVSGIDCATVAGRNAADPDRPGGAERVAFSVDPHMRAVRSLDINGRNRHAACRVQTGRKRFNDFAWDWQA